MTKSHQSDIESKVGGEGALLSLLVPSLDPGVGADSSEVLVEELARLVLFTLQLLATVKVNIVLPAVPGLVLVREPGVEGDGLLQGVLNELSHLPLKNARNSLVEVNQAIL